MVQSNVRLERVLHPFLISLALFWFIGFERVSTALGQGYLDLANYKSEHLITHGIGQTGDISIYLSFPNWFAKSAGYCPIRVRVVPQKGLVFKSDGMLQLSISSGQRVSEGGPRTVLEIPIEQGATEARGEILANLFDIQIFNLSAKLNGRKLSGQRLYSYNRATGANQNLQNRDLVIISSSTAKADRNRQAALSEMKRTGNWFSQAEYIAGATSLGSYADAVTFPTNWLYLSGLDQISISTDELPLLSSEAVECIHQYVLAGGVLDVSKVSSMAEVVKYFHVDSRRKMDGRLIQRSSSRSVSEILQSQLQDLDSEFELLENSVWDRFIQDKARLAFNRASNPYTTYANVSPQGMNRSPEDLFDFADQLSTSLIEVASAYVDMELAGVEVVASRLYGANPIERTVESETEDNLTTATTIPHGFGVVRLDPKVRRDSASTLNDPMKGAFLISVNRTERFKGGIGDDFWDWLIPSVGRTPVVPFLLFVVLFVGVVVPGLMFWCNRHKRRVWLVVAMPLTALFFTVLLFGYGLLKDGLGAVSRIRSLAFLDSEGEGIVWSRQSYFAARVPPQGMLLRPDTQIVPLLASSVRELPECQQMEIDGQQQYLGLLPPRLQTQFSVTHPLRKVILFRRDNKIDPVLEVNGIVNCSGFRWSKAMFVDRRGKAFIATDVQNDQAAALTETEKNDALAILQKAYQSKPLESPADSPSADQISLNQFFGDLFSYNRYRPNSVGLIFEEDFWKNSLGIVNTKATTIGVERATPFLPNTFVILSDQAPYLERCMTGVQDENGLHTIIGRW
jgi:hypothetical protein